MIMLMKKITFILTVFLLASSFAYSATGWFSDFVLIDKNSGGEQYYWIGGDPTSGTELNNNDFGVVASLVITGCDMKYWSDTQDRTGGAFYYKIMSSDNSTEVVAPVEVLWNQTYLGGNDYQGALSAQSINLLASLAKNTSYKLHVWAKSWGTGQGDNWLSNGGANYVATFTTDNTTGTSQTLNKIKVYAENNIVKATFSGKANIQLLTITGQQLKSTVATDEFAEKVYPGVYVLRVNGKSHKVLVK
jgi:hypothetical protein